MLLTMHAPCLLQSSALLIWSYNLSGINWHLFSILVPSFTFTVSNKPRQIVSIHEDCVYLQLLGSLMSPCNSTVVSPMHTDLLMWGFLHSLCHCNLPYTAVFCWNTKSLSSLLSRPAFPCFLSALLCSAVHYSLCYTYQFHKRLWPTSLFGSRASLIMSD